MSQARTRPWIALGAIAVAGAIVEYLSLGSIGDNLVYFWDVPQLLDKKQDAVGATIRLGGVVRKGSMNWQPETVELKFDIANQPEVADSNAVTVYSKGAPPQMFREGIGVVVEGKYDGQQFQADRVIVKHSNEYRPPEEGREPENVYKTLLEDS